MKPSLTEFLERLEVVARESIDLGFSDEAISGLVIAYRLTHLQTSEVQGILFRAGLLDPESAADDLISAAHGLSHPDEALPANGGWGGRRNMP